MSKNEKYYIAVNTGEKYPLLKDALTYTEYFKDAMVFNYHRSPIYRKARA